MTSETPSLAPPVDGEHVELTGRAGRMTVHVAGEGPPLLLVHSVNAAAGAAEVKPLYGHYRRTRTVFAPDLPGFGLSDRSDRAYTVRLMTDAVLDLVDLVRQRHGPQPVDALGLSLGCEFVARAALEQPGAFRSLALVGPTGLQGGRSLRGACCRRCAARAGAVRCSAR